MAKRITWSEQAHKDRKEILQFWQDHNKSKTYSIKLNRLFKEAVQIISEFPKIGNRTNFRNPDLAPNFLMQILLLFANQDYLKFATKILNN